MFSVHTARLKRAREIPSPGRPTKFQELPADPGRRGLNPTPKGLWSSIPRPAALKPLFASSEHRAHLCLSLPRLCSCGSPLRLAHSPRRPLIRAHLTPAQPLLQPPLLATGPGAFRSSRSQSPRSPGEPWREAGAAAGSCEARSRRSKLDRPQTICHHLNLNVRQQPIVMLIRP